MHSGRVLNGTGTTLVRRGRHIQHFVVVASLSVIEPTAVSRNTWTDGNRATVLFCLKRYLSAAIT